jgi:glutathione synthase/RimK-type ligase-like ATP-grasp enzyme
MAKVLILTDYKNEFLISIEDLVHYTAMNAVKVSDLLRSYGHSVELLRFSELDLEKRYDDHFILYQTSEDIGAFYKSYIEDIALWLELKGAVLLPSFKYLRAHHNKNFMELLRYDFKDGALKNIKSRPFGTLEDAMAHELGYPVVIKSAEGSGSRGVLLAVNKNDYIRKVKKLSGVFLVNTFKSVKDFILYRIYLGLFNRAQAMYNWHTFYRKKFIVQNFVEGLDGDYKVLRFGEKFYTLYRKNRKNDFRASGSGNLCAANDDEVPGLLDFAEKASKEIDFPICGMDIGFDGKFYYLLEFQCIHIGPYALQCAESWYERVQGEWRKFFGRSNLEEEYCRVINDYVGTLVKIKKEDCYAK